MAVEAAMMDSLGHGRAFHQYASRHGYAPRGANVSLPCLRIIGRSMLLAGMKSRCIPRIPLAAHPRKGLLRGGVMHRDKRNVRMPQPETM